MSVEPCCYCGFPATTIDHVVPQSLLNTVRLSTGGVIDWREMLRARVLTVPCCGECNSVLGDRVYPTIADRRAAIKKRLRRKYRKLLCAPRWSENDLDEMGPDLRGYVARKQTLREDVEQRLRWASGKRPLA